MTDRKDPPIREVEYLSGPSVIDIGDVRVARGLSRRPFSSCKHRALNYDPQERRIWCKDCEQDIDPFDAFVIVAEQCHGFLESLKRRARQIAEAEAFTARSRAVKALDKIWRSRNMAPCCPHCNRGLLPEDMVRLGSVGVEYERAMRLKDRSKP